MDFYQTPNIRIRLSLVIATFGLLSVGMLVRSTWLQIIHDPKLENLANKQFQSKILMKPRRGLITDRTGEPLAINLETSSLAGNPSKILKSPATLHLLAHAMGVRPGELKKRLDPKRSFFWVERHISDERMEKLHHIGIVQANGDMPEGLWIVKEMKRVYPHGELGASLLGGVNVDTEGLEGVELWKNSSLRGKSASFEAYKDALGRPAMFNNDAQTKTTDGENTELSIDASLQYSVEESLNEAVAKTGADSGLVIVMDSNTGEILALAQSPANHHVKKVTALTDGYEPGSTMKPFTIAAALELGKVTPETVINTEHGMYEVGGRKIHDTHHEASLTVAQVIQKSSNVGASKIALTMKPATMSYGNGISVNLLQLARAYTVYANDGELRPVTLIKQEEATAGSKVFSATTARAVRDMLEMVVKPGGTAPLAQIVGYRVAGKTGTAHKLENGHYVDRYVASFVGMAPASNPRLIVAVMINEPSGAEYYGGQVAAPAFSNVMGAALRLLNVPNDAPLNNVMQPDPADFVREEV